MTDFIVVTGGVVSGIGKGVLTASLGYLLSDKKKIVPIKCDGYLNVDPGTLNPFEHGEVFVLDDGGEVDMDFGHYERFLNISCKKEWSLTSGKLFQQIIQKERQGVFLGATVQILPHLVQEIKQQWLDIAKKEKADIVLIEIGGVVGDMENPWFVEAARQLKKDVGNQQVTYVHLTLLPYLSSVGEQKTKPAQRDLELLRAKGITPDVIVVRSKNPCSLSTKQKIALSCSIEDEAIINLPDVANIYDVPLLLRKEKISEIIAKKHKLASKKDITQWKKFCHDTSRFDKTIRIALCGKYTSLQDSYASLLEALKHAAYNKKRKVQIDFVDTVALEKGILTPQQALADIDGVVIPIGFGDRGTEGKIALIEYVRKHNIPFLGLCMGLQLAVIEFARNVCGITDASSEEFGKTKNPVVCYLPQQDLSVMGASMRLGNHLSLLKKGTIVQKIYGNSSCNERHRHRYEVNPKYYSVLTEHGLVISGTSEDGMLVEFIELSSKQHPFFVATQAHPEYSSRPGYPHPLFTAFISAALHTKTKKTKKVMSHMKLSFTFFITVFLACTLILLLFSFSYLSSFTFPFFPEQSASMEIDEDMLVYHIFLATNNLRQERGLEPLYLDANLSLLAKEHSQDMLNRSFFNHTNPDGEDATARAERHGFPTMFINLESVGFSGIGENIAFVVIDKFCSEAHPVFSGDCFVDLWFASEGHRENLLNPHYRVIGVGTACSETGCFATQNFRVGGEEILYNDKNLFRYDDVTILTPRSTMAKFSPFPGGLILQLEENTTIWSNKQDPATVIITDNQRTVGYSRQADSYHYTIR